MFSGRLWNIFIDSFPKMLLRALTGNCNCICIGDGDCNCGCSGAVCEC